MKNTSFHNTINLDIKQLDLFEKKAQSLQDKIVEFMRNHPRQMFTPWDIHKAFNGKYLIGSIRRAMTNESNQKGIESPRLIKTDQRVIEGQGCLNYKWIFNSNKQSIV